ncbi:MAG: dTDP-glucose 4,6-dehydratase [Deltaproteobacteria bacterium]|nr:MAG: dTDP-glucose 4,6-dehydratase [Deltaproteobacteria bacterium]
MKILVTGGAGFIGSNFIRYLLEKYNDYQVVNLDKLTYAGNLENLRDIEKDPNYEFIKGDIGDAGLVEEILQRGIEIIINFAAESHVDRSIEDPQVFIKTNVLGTQTLLDAGRKQGISRFIQISTDEVYGSLGATGYFTESTPLAPNSPYSASKASADLLVRAYCMSYGFPAIISRCSNNYGSYQFPEKLIPLVITNALEGKELPVYGDGLNIRDWIYVDDHSRALDLVLHQGRLGEIYNIGGENERTNLDIVKFIVKELRKPESLITFVKDRPGHDRRYAIDSSKLRKELGWKSQTDFQGGLRETIRWYLDNRKWWEKVKSGEYREYYTRMYGNRST